MIYLITNRINEDNRNIQLKIDESYWNIQLKIDESIRNNEVKFDELLERKEKLVVMIYSIYETYEWID